MAAADDDPVKGDPEKGDPEKGDPEKKGRALQLILDAWDTALAEGAEPEVIASVAIYAALADMVDRYGEEAVAAFCATLPDRARHGEFTLRANQP